MKASAILGMKASTIFLASLAMFAVMLAHLATLPLLLQPGYLAAGATAPTDVSEVVAASELLKKAGVALLVAAILVERARPRAALSFCAWAAAAYTMYRVWEVMAIIVVWAAHVRGEHAMTYWLAVIATPLFALLAVASIVPFLLSLTM